MGISLGNERVTSPRFASTDESKGRTYRIPGIDKDLASVTTIIGMLHKPALMPWAAKLAAERAIQSADTWQAIAQEEGDEAARKWISAAAREYTNRKALIGSAVHWVCENSDNLDDKDVQGKLDWFCRQLGGDEAKERKNILNHLESYRRFLSEHDVEIVEQELTVANPAIGYAGTLDGIARIDDKMCIFDIKTGNAYSSASLQMAAYRFATHKVQDGKGVPVGHPNACLEDAYGIYNACVVVIKPKSYKIVPMRANDVDYDAFVALCAVRQWEEYGHQMGGEWW